jgi:hypothetical protein
MQYFIGSTTDGMKNYGSVWLHKFVKIFKRFTFQTFPRLDSYFQDMTYSDDVRSEVLKGIYMYRLKLQLFCFGNTKDKFVGYTT